jgi:hypothetical protein
VTLLSNLRHPPLQAPHAYPAPYFLNFKYKNRPPQSRVCGVVGLRPGKPNIPNDYLKFLGKIHIQNVYSRRSWRSLANKNNDPMHLFFDSATQRPSRGGFWHVASYKNSCGCSHSKDDYGETRIFKIYERKQIF